MKAILRCIHPLLWISLGIFAFLVLILHEHLTFWDLLPIDLGHSEGRGHGLPILVFFLPSYFMFVLGVGFSGIRLFVLRCKRRRSREEAE
jgi:hypothetical protein